jgi:ferredoxin/flavodoxin
MKITMACFSQTGNTLRVAESIAMTFQDAGHTIQLLPMMTVEPQVVLEGDILGIGSPCFSSRAPTPVRNFLANLPYLNQRRAFVFATCGGAPGRILYDLVSGLQGRGAEIIGSFLTLGEVHHPAPAVHGRYPGRPNCEDLDKASVYARKVVENTRHEDFGASGIDRKETSRPGLGFYDLVACVSSEPSKRLLLPKPIADNEACDGCQRCVMECPQENITMHPYPRVGERCIRCYHCVNCCPQNAMHANWSMRNWIVKLLYNQTFVQRFGYVDTADPE